MPRGTKFIKNYVLADQKQYIISAMIVFIEFNHFKYWFGSVVVR